MSVCLFVLVGTRTHTRAHSLTHAHTHKRAAHSLGVSTAAALSLSTVVSCFRTSPAMALAFLAACCCFGDVADDETLTRLKQSSGGRVRDDERSLLYIYLFFLFLPRHFGRRWTFEARPWTRPSKFNFTMCRRRVRHTHSRCDDNSTSYVFIYYFLRGVCDRCTHNNRILFFTWFRVCFGSGL